MNEKILVNMDEVKDFFNAFNVHKYSFDTETLPTIKDEPKGALRYTDLIISGISFCDGKSACYIPIETVYNFTDKKYLDCDNLFEFLNDIVFNSKNEGKDRTIICHNIVFDMMVIHKYGARTDLGKWFDTLVAVHLIDENRKFKGLKYLTLFGSSR